MRETGVLLHPVMNILYTCLIVLAVVAAVALLLLLIAVIRTLVLLPQVSTYQAATDAGSRRRALAYATTLSELVACDTTSFPGQREPERFAAFHRVLEQKFPLVHQHLAKTDIDGNLLFHWPGDRQDKPLVLMSHQDVVPAEGEWEHEPFSGDIADGYVWGRGSADTKCSLFGFFQAVEELLAGGFVPKQDIYLSSSCTEEWAGDGCPKLVAELERRGVRPFLVVDEGGAIITDPIGGIKGNFAMIGVYEKGKADIRFTAVGRGGHASAPGRLTPMARLADFMHEMEHRSPFRRHMSSEVSAMFRDLAPYAGFGLRLVFANLWLFRPLLLVLLPKISAQAGAMLKTTIAFTMAKGSDAYNVLPQKASVGANVRFIPHQGMEESLGILRRHADRHGLAMEVVRANDYSRPIDIHGEAFGLVRRIVTQTFPGLPSSPYVMTGATDAIHYQRICDNVVRFAPVIYGPEQMKGMHGVNETIAYDCLPACVDFYRNLICAM